MDSFIASCRISYFGGESELKLICISGKAGHGKDTAAMILKNGLEIDGYNVLITHYADLLKYICRTFFDWNGEKDENGRKLLQYVGTNVVRNKNPDYWVDFVVNIIHLFYDEWDYVIIPDCRFQNEIDLMRKSGFDTTHIRIVRRNFKSPLTIEQQRHPSETALDGCVPDYYIYNDGTISDLRLYIENWIVEITGSHQLRLNESLELENKHEQ